MEETKFIRPSFGENAGLGCMYDARSDTFLNSGILEPSMPETLISVEGKRTKDCKIIPNGSWSTKFTVLEIPKHSCLSVLIGTVNLDGIGKCFSNVQEEAKIYKALLMYQIKTVSEHVEIFRDELKPFILLDKLDQTNATHIVTKIIWGSTTFVSFEIAEQHCSNPDVFIKHMEDLINKLNNMLTNGDPDIESSIPNSALEKITFRVNSDIIPEEQVFTNIGDLRSLLKSISDLTSSTPNLYTGIYPCYTGKGKIVSFEMIPIATLAEKFNLNNTGTNNFVSIGDEITTRFIQAFDDMFMLKRQIHDIHEEVKQTSFCLSEVDVESVLKFDSNLASFETTFKQDLARNILKVRSGEADQSALESLLEKLGNHQKNLESLNATCQKYIENSKVKLEFMTILKSKHVSFIFTPADVDNLHRQNADRDTYLLIYNATSARRDSENWKSQFKTFNYLINTNRNPETVLFAFLDNSSVSIAEFKNIAIHHLKGNEKISCDVHADVQKMAQLCLAYSDEINIEKIKSIKRGNVHLKCPGSFRNPNPCSAETHGWQCKTCLDFLQYGFDGYFYCSCGCAPSTSYEFKCNDTPKHTLYYIKFKGIKNLNPMLQQIQPYKELNIVILGETGVGKSTWINGFANYLTYDTLDVALADEPLCLIPTSFTMRNKKEGKSVLIEMGKKSKNESNANGQSSTQMPKSYIFFVNDIRVCLIDTPGIGDTRGIEQDRANFQNIMSHLAYVNEIHGICILLKPNNSRLGVMFQFCIQELLTHLHKDACQNIVFVFTNARSTFYSAGDTSPLLEALLKNKIKGAIKLEENTEYYMDNESVRFLAAKRAGIEFTKLEYDTYAQSWLQSVEENRRLLEQILKLPAHQTKNTLSLNEARRLILELTKPLAEISKNIQDNIRVIERKKAEIVDIYKNKEDLQEKLYIPHIDLESQPIEYPRTVCTSMSCIDVFKSDNGTEIRDYKTWCHEHCGLRNVVVEQYPTPELKNCAAMHNGKCRNCGCWWSSHMHITYTTKQVPTKIIDRNIENKIKSESEAINVVNEFIQAADDRLRKFNEEQQIINATAAKFGNFLKYNAITPYNDATANYLKYEINNEEGLVGHGSDNKRLSSLRDLLHKYNREVEILEETMKDGQQTQAFTSEEIQKLIDILYDLPINGKMLKEMMTVAGQANLRMAEQQAFVHEFRSTKRKQHGGLSKAFSTAKNFCYGVVQKFF